MKGGKITAAGDRRYGELDDVGTLGLYWSSTPYGEDGAYGLYVDSSRAGWYDWYDSRYNEISVRPVR